MPRCKPTLTCSRCRESFTAESNPLCVVPMTRDEAIEAIKLAWAEFESESCGGDAVRAESKRELAEILEALGGHSVCNPMKDKTL